jgi:hypothetical protein
MRSVGRGWDHGAPPEHDVDRLPSPRSSTALRAQLDGCVHVCPRSSIVSPPHREARPARMRLFPTGSRQILLVSLATRVPSTAQQTACGNEPGGTVRLRKDELHSSSTHSRRLHCPRSPWRRHHGRRESILRVFSVKAGELHLACSTPSYHRQIAGLAFGLDSPPCSPQQICGPRGGRKTREPSTRPFAAARRNGRANTCTPQADRDVFAKPCRLHAQRLVLAMRAV